MYLGFLKTMLIKPKILNTSFIGNATAVAAIVPPRTMKTLFKDQKFVIGTEFSIDPPYIPIPIRNTPETSPKIVAKSKL